MTIGAGIFLYLMIQIGIGIWVSRKIKSEQDYFLAGRSLGVGLATVSIFATWFGAETCIGSSAAIFDEGLAGGRADPFGYTICLILSATFLASQLWKRKLTTLSDLYRQRFSSSVEKFTVYIMVPSSIIWAAAQIRAFGQIVSATTSIEVDLAITLAATFIVFYTFLGGLLGDVITDLIQGGILVAGLVILFGFGVSHVGGVESAIDIIKSSPERLSIVAKGESFLSRMDTWMIPILGSLGTQEVVAKILACKSAKVARRSNFYASGIYLVIGLIPVCLGLLGPSMGLTLSDKEQFLPMLAQKMLPPILFIVFSGALISAILSTVDSTLLAAGALISHNVIVPMKPGISERGKLMAGRYVVVASGAVAYILAIYGGSIYDLVEAASAFGAAGLLIITFAGLWTKFGGPFAANVTLFVGLVVTPLGEYVFELEAPFMTSCLISLVTYIGAEYAYQMRNSWRSGFKQTTEAA